MSQAERELQMFTGNWCYSVKLSLKGWKLANTGKILKQQHLPAKICARAHTQADGQKL